MRSNKDKKSPKLRGIRGRELEILIVALLLTDKLRVKNVVLERSGEYLVALVGEFSLFENQNKEIQDIAKSIDKNPNMTVSQVVDLITRKKRV
jgi:hypothetical protein